MHRRSITCLSAAAALLACGAAHAGPSVEGSEKGLGVTGPQTPDLLRQMAQDPYAVPAEVSCADLTTEIATLDQLLGPDVDAPAGPESGRNFGQVAFTTAKSLIPYRGVVRMVTGAGKKEREYGQAMMAGAARRGFLRGLYAEKACGAAPVIAAASHADDAVARIPVDEPEARPVSTPTLDALLAEVDPPARP